MLRLICGAAYTAQTFFRGKIIDCGFKWSRPIGDKIGYIKFDNEKRKPQINNHL